MSDETSLVKAKYADAVLKVAMRSDKRSAALLIEGLASEFPDFDDPPHIAAAHQRAIEVYGSLTESLRGPAGASTMLWQAAVDATKHWRLLLP